MCPTRNPNGDENMTNLKIPTEGIYPVHEAFCIWFGDADPSLESISENGPLTNPRTPQFSGTEDLKWDDVDTTFKGFSDAYYERTGKKRPDEDYTEFSKCPEEMRKWISKHSILGNPDGKTFREGRMLPVVNPHTGKLNKTAVVLANQFAGRITGISEDTLKKTKKYLRKMYAKYFKKENEPSDEGFDISEKYIIFEGGLTISAESIGGKIVGKIGELKNKIKKIIANRKESIDEKAALDFLEKEGIPKLLKTEGIDKVKLSDAAGKDGLKWIDIGTREMWKFHEALWVLGVGEEDPTRWPDKKDLNRKSVFSGNVLKGSVGLGTIEVAPFPVSSGTLSELGLDTVEKLRKIVQVFFNKDSNNDVYKDGYEFGLDIMKEHLEYAELLEREYKKDPKGNEYTNDMDSSEAKWLCTELAPFQKSVVSGCTKSLNTMYTAFNRKHIQVIITKHILDKIREAASKAKK